MEENNIKQNLFNRNTTEKVPINANEFSALVGFFNKRGFSKSSATEIASILIGQAQLQNIPVFQLVDTLKGLDDVKLSDVITQLINLNRSKASSIGYVINNTPNPTETRNIEGL